MAVLSPSWTLDGVIVILSAFLAAYLYMTRNFRYWAKRGFTEQQPIPFFGNMLGCTFFQKSVSSLIEDLYSKYEGHSQVGFYIYDKPCLIVRDLDLVNRILVKDFNSFSNRYVSTSEQDTLGSANLFVIQNPHWKILRSKLSPTMTSGKLKQMFHLMVAVAKDLDTHLESLDVAGEGRVVELRETWAKFTTDVIATCAYGVQANSLNDPNAEFRRFGRKIFDSEYWRSLELRSMFFIPSIVKPFGFKFFGKSTSDFLSKALWDTLIQRMENDIRRNDLIDTLIELKKAQAEIEVDDPNSFKFDGDNLTAQAAIYFSGGFETTASTLAFALHELALHPEIQFKLRDTINSALEENGGEMRYEWVMQLPYLDMVVSETLRKYPVLGIIARVATSDYKVPDSDLVIEKGTPVFVPVAGIHHDPEYYPDPEKFDPERFGAENKPTRSTSRTYLPFGDGPRNCLGLRFGLLTIKVGLIRMITNYKFTPSEETKIPLRIDPLSIFISMQDDLFLRVQKITPTS